MNLSELLIDVARRPLLAAEQLRGRLSPELLNAHPHHDNSIAWLLWHAAREIDEQLRELHGQDAVWVAGGFAERFALPTGIHEHGYGHSPAQARAIVVNDQDLLFEYLSAVIDAQVAYIAGREESEFSAIVDARWDPPVTLAARLVSMSFDAGEHVGQAAYVSGIGGGGFEPR